MTENGRQRHVRVWLSHGVVGRAIVAVVLIATGAAVFATPPVASALMPLPDFDAPGSPATSTGTEAPSLSAAEGEIAPYSEDPIETGPFAVCPPPTQTRVSCMGVGVPSPAKVEALGLTEPDYEGSGKSGGFSPADLRSAYNLPGEGGAGQTVAITIAYDNPNAEADLAKYREEYKLPECSKKNGCFKKVNQKGEEGNYPAPNAEWAAESSLDLDMVSAVCPKCKILLVEANNNLTTNMYAAVEQAAKLGATVISNSWEGDEYPGQEAEDHYFDYPGVPVLFASGDDGYGVEYPSASSKAIAVGGTSLEKAVNARGWSERAWIGAGSGCSKYSAKPAWQKDGGCGKRTVADVAAVADPETPVSVYDTYERPGWMLVGGTSVATPILAGIEALSASAVRAAGPSAFAPMGQSGELFDVVEGENALCGTYLCQAEVGFDGPTGWGTPNGPLALPVAVTEAASVGSTSKATLRGSVRPGGLETKYRFEYGETLAYGSVVPVPDKSIGSGSSYAEVSQAIEGLKGQRTYHYRIVATNSSGSFYGLDRTFGTTPPAVSTGAAAELDIYDATVKGTVNPEGSSTSYYVEYGPTTSYGSHLPLRAKDVGAGTKAVEVSTEIGELESGSTYHYRLVAKNAAGTAFGADKIFTTLPPQWRAQKLPKPEGASDQREAYGVSCARSDVCVAVGSQWKLGSFHTLVTMAQVWNGTSWSAMATPNPPGLEEGWKSNKYATFDAVACSTVTDCMAVGHFRGVGAVVEPLSQIWNGTGWEELSTAKPSGAGEATLSGVACTAPAACVAVGSYVNGSGTRTNLVTRWNGTKWEEQAAPNPSGATSSRLTGVSCTSSTQCTAVGYFKNSSNAERTLALRWNGSSWQEQATVNPAGASTARLNAVSCTSTVACSAVGFYQSGYHTWTLAQRWNGSTWLQQATPTPYEEGTLDGISCTSSTSCTAAGASYNSAPFDHGWRPLIERWSGSSWTVASAAPLPAPTGWWHEAWLTSISCPLTGTCFSAGNSLEAPQGGFASEVAFIEQSLGPPKATTEAATGATQTEVTLRGSVNPNGLETNYYFEYGPTLAYGSKTKVVGAGSGMASLKVNETIGGLSASSTYHFRIVATNVHGTSEGADQTLSTTGKPTVETKPANNVTETGASLKGSVNPRGAETQYFFEYGLTGAYGSKTSEKSAGAGGGFIEAFKFISGLTEGTTYHFRIVATNSYGTSVGNDMTFKTPEYLGSWKITSTPNPVGTLNSYLWGVSCPVSATSCTAVGQYTVSEGGELPLAERWNGSEWSLQSIPAPAGAKKTNLYEVSCASSTSCVAAGYYRNSSGVYFALAEVWNGTEWKIQATPEPAGTLNALLMSVSCTASTQCTAVGYYENSGGAVVGLAQRWNGTEWKSQTVPSPAGAKEVNPTGVSCTAATNCTMVGHYESSSGVLVPFAQTWNGTEWSLQSVPGPSGSTRTEVGGVSCTAASACTMVGTYKNTGGADVGFAERWDGSGWSVQGTAVPSGSKGHFLHGVACSSATVCTAVGVNLTTGGKYTTLAERWNGAEWVVQSTPNDGEGKGWLSGGVSCASPKACVGVGNTGKALAEVYG